MFQTDFMRFINGNILVFVNYHEKKGLSYVILHILPTNVWETLSHPAPGGGGGVLPEKLGGGVLPASQNPYPIFDQSLRNSLPYL